MPEEVKMIMDDPSCEPSEFCPILHQQHHLQQDREMSRSESSSCSEELACCKLNGHEVGETIPTRTLKTSVPKPAANPLQFVKIGPCDLYRSAQQQLQKVGEVKKPKQEIKDEIEDWQSNLDNWKCSRRKQQEHIIERVVEVKKLELEEHDRNRKRTKTFNEMMEERTSKGRKLSLPVYLDESEDDLSDLGLSTTKNTPKSSSPIPEEHNEKMGRDDDSEADLVCKNNEATYESAIQSYETRMKSLTTGTVVSNDGDSNEPKSALPLPVRLIGGSKKFHSRRASAAKIEEKLGELERVKNRSVSSSDLSSFEVNKKSLGIPKVDIFARKEVFEKKPDEKTDLTEKSTLVALSEEVPRVRSIKERLSSLEKSIEEGNKLKNTAPLTDVSVRNRLFSINEKLRMELANGSSEKSIPSPASCTSFRSSAHAESNSPIRVGQPKSAVCFLRPTSQVESESKVRPKEDAPAPSIGRNNRGYSSSGRSSSSEDYENVAHNQHRVGHHFHHRSLDSLQGHDSPNGFCFERVQSLECVDCCGSNYPASVLSGDTDREDSGIHTADVSSSVSQVDDFDLHADSSIDADVKCSPLTPNPAGLTVVDGVVTCQTNIYNSSQNGGCHSYDPFAEGEPPPSVTQPTNVSDVRRYDASIERGDFSLIENTRQLESPNYDDPIRVSSCGSLSNAFQPCGVTQLDDRRLPTSDAGVFNNCGLVDEENRFANETAVGPKRDSIESHIIDEILEPLKSCHPMINASQSIDYTRTVQNNLVANEEQRQMCEEDLTVGSGSSPGETLRTPGMAIESESTPVSGFQASSVNRGNETSDLYSNSRPLSSAPDTPDGLAAVHSAAVFAFELSAANPEPPKEKPPPPPSVHNSDNDESDIVENCGLRRMDSTKRIKKEIRLKRSSFLGIEGKDEDSYLEPELESVKRPPDMMTFLQEERRLEKLLYRQSICSESDSILGESRDSGVELDKNHIDEHSWITGDTHSRQNSDIYATSVASEEDEIIRKEREILELLELEERRNSENNFKHDFDDLGEKLVSKLKELEGRKPGCCLNRERDNRMSDCNSVEPFNATEQSNAPIRSQSQPQKQRQLLEGNRSDSESAALPHQTQRVQVRSLQDVSRDLNVIVGSGGLKSDKLGLECNYSHRSSMPNILQETTTIPSPYHRVPPPIPPNKPTHSKKAGPANNEVSCPQQMTKQTLQALSAVPRSKIIATDSWVLSKKKPRQEAFNYQHWLIQEAEHRRITEYHQRYGNDTGHNNYANALIEYIDGKTLLPSNNTTTPVDSHSSAHHPGRFSRVHPQMLPSYRNHSRSSIDEKKPTKSQCKPLPDSVIQTLTQRVQSRLNVNDAAYNPKRRENYQNQLNQQEKMLSVSGKKKCSHCGEELGRGAAMIIESLRLFYHIDCFKCCVCCVQLGDGLMGTDVRVRNSKLHCHSCYSNDEGLKFSCV